MGFSESKQIRVMSRGSAAPVSVQSMVFSGGEVQVRLEGLSQFKGSYETFLIRARLHEVS